jgi:hypothetical protein
MFDRLENSRPMPNLDDACDLSHVKTENARMQRH